MYATRRKGLRTAHLGTMLFCMAQTTTQADRLAAIVDTALATAGISVKSASESAHIPRETLRRRLAGVTPFTIDELHALAAVLDTTPSALMRQAEQGDAA